MFAEEKFSPSERAGLALLTESDLLVYAPGVSTGGVAEMKMAEMNQARKVIATTIDPEGAKSARELVEKYGYGDRIEVKLEDVSKKLPYADATFDFVYARLVLHYLSRFDLQAAVEEIYRILKPNRKFFVVVRSNRNEEVSWPESAYDEGSGLTAVTYSDRNTGQKNVSKRFFHSEESITGFLKSAGFTPESVKTYNEQLYIDFDRKKPAPKTDNVIEVVSRRK